MKPSVLLTITSLLSILLFLFHITGDITHGMEPGGLNSLVGSTLIVLVFLCGTLLFGDRLSGHVIQLVGALLAIAVAYIHMRGKGVGGDFAKADGGFFFVWTLLALGVTGAFGVVLSVRGLWGLRKGQPK
jgi:hypothetical protein